LWRDDEGGDEMRYNRGIFWAEGRVAHVMRLRKMAEGRVFASTVPWEMKALMVLVEQGSEWGSLFLWYGYKEGAQSICA